MIDIEKLLAQSGSAKPRRPLRTGFTNQVTDYVAGHPRPKGLARLKELLTMKLHITKPIAAGAACAFILLAGGTSFAAAGGWPRIQALFGEQTDLPGGGRIVRVDTENCTFTDALSIVSGNNQKTYYYKVKKDSKLTNEQVVQIVRGNCETAKQITFDTSVVQTALARNPLNKDTVVGGYIDSKITAVSGSHISLESVVPYGNPNGIELKTIRQTFTHIDPQVLVYDSPHTITMSDLKVGDRVSIKYRASGEALMHSETQPLDQVNNDEQVVVAIIKNSHDMSAAIDFQKYNGHEFEQVIPCDHDDFCTVVEYYQNKTK
jgi:hypothetical protein